MHFTSNHDENSWKGTVKERLGDAIKTFAVLSATMEGTPLIYNGQEASLDKRLEFFEKDAIEWTDFSMTPFYQQLLDLNHKNQALWNGEDGGEIQVLSPESDSLGFAFYREMNEDEVLCVFNFSAEKRTVQFDNPSTNSLTELFNESELVSEQVEITLPAWGYAVYHNE